ncbi:hypothetical protein PGTUg99_035842 [Puccinia graminis f. sp. tritici]|uniref:Uncharacterized protein n=1 Tax=Puccinia graminis f. sp. tritici TaxID=56615 RepID=A0A5B0QA61_PUCGR|nr:hypothetical protein PGTUg99_035842 [Puccinia graminis f. sp. tritici]
MMSYKKHNQPEMLEIWKETKQLRWTPPKRVKSKPRRANGGKVSITIEAPSGYFRTFLRVWMGVHFIQKSDIESHTEPCR